MKTTVRMDKPGNISLRTRALPRLSVERGRSRGPLRSIAAPVFCSLLWNGRDHFLKERIFGLGGPEGNHGEDAKEYWWYIDATPTSSWLRWRYHYPHGGISPTRYFGRRNARRNKDEPEFELVDTGALRRGSLLADHRGLRQSIT